MEKVSHIHHQSTTTTKSPCFSGNHKTTMPAKLPSQQQTRVGGRSSTKSWNTTEKGFERELNTKQKKSNKCLLTTTPNGTKMFSPPTAFTTKLHCSFSTLFAYELWIENWDCDFPSALTIYHAALFFLAVPSLFISEKHFLHVLSLSKSQLFWGHWRTLTIKSLSLIKLEPNNQPTNHPQLIN